MSRRLLVVADVLIGVTLGAALVAAGIAATAKRWGLW